MIFEEYTTLHLNGFWLNGIWLHFSLLAFRKRVPFHEISDIWPFRLYGKFTGTKAWTIYRVTQHVVRNLPLTLKQKFPFGLARPGQARPKRNLCFEVNGMF